MLYSVQYHYRVEYLVLVVAATRITPTVTSLKKYYFGLGQKILDPV